MANWLDKALGRKSSTTSVAIVPFDVLCECGSRLTGVRAERAKRAICAQCGEAHFILPVNRYPESERTYFAADATKPDASEPRHREAADTAPRPTDVYAVEATSAPEATEDIDPGFGFDDDDFDDPDTRTSTSAIAGDADDSDDLLGFLDEPPDTQKQHRKRRDSLYDLPESDRPLPADEPDLPERPARRSTSRQAATRSRAATAPSGMVEVRRKESGGAETRRRVVQVTIGIVILAIGMAFWAVHSQTVDHAETRLATAKDAGLDAFEVGDFGEARNQLQVALEALEIVGADEEQIAPVRRKWLEAEFATHLLDGSLVDIAEATRDAKSLDREEWEKQFDAKFGDHWLLLDLSPIETVKCSRKDDEGRLKSTETRLLYPWTVDDKPVHVAGVESLLASGRSRAVLAARLIGSEFDSDSDAWVVRMDPDDSFLWTDFSVLVQLGFVTEGEEDNGLRQVLAEQQSAGNGSEASSDSALAENPSDASDEETE